MRREADPDDPSENVAGIIDPVAFGDPERAALIVGDVTSTYADLAGETGRWAGTLAVVGVGPGDRIALVDWGGLRSTAVTLAAAHLGAATCLMNPLLTASELAVLVEGSGCARVGVATGEAAPALADALGPGGVLLDHPAASAAAPARAAGGDADALVLFTSGTTGVPKPVSVSHRSLLARVRAYRAQFDASRPASVSLMCVPSFHVGGMLGLLVTLYGADTTVVLPRFDAGNWLEAVARHRVATAFVVPTMLARILDHPSLGATDVSSLRTISYGAAAAPAALIERAMEQWPTVGFVNVFGQTETLGAYAALSADDHRDPRRVGSVGRAMPGVEVRVVDPVTGAERDDGQQGELWVRTTQAVHHDHDGGWLATGDLGHRDADGYLFPAGRRSDVINRGGEKFGPREVAEALRAHPAIDDVAVAGIPDQEMGQRVGAVVVLVAGAARPTLDELRTWCRTGLASFKLPEVVVVADRIPYNELGKIPARVVVDLIRTAPDREPTTGDSP